MKRPYNTLSLATGGAKTVGDDESVQRFVRGAFLRAKEANFSPEQFKTLKSEIKTLITAAKERNLTAVNNWTVQHVPILDGLGLKLDLYCNLEGENLKMVDSARDKRLFGAKTRRGKTNVFGESSDESEGEGPIAIVKKLKHTNGNPVVRLKKVKKLSTSPTPGTEMSSSEKLAERSKRFERELKTSTRDVSYEMDALGTGPIVGTNKTLEKKYLRLTSQPKPATVRPLGVLKKTLALLRSKYFEGATYNYLCDQCKSMRQDLTVQNIKTPFTVEVYQFHSRLAIEFGDLGELNQCQSQLKILYEEDNLKSANWLEFVSFRFLYYILTDNRNEIDQLMIHLIELGDNSIEDPYIKSALTLDKILLKKNYTNLRKLIVGLRSIKDPQDEMKKPMFFSFLSLLEQILKLERPRILLAVCRAYRQLGMDYLGQLLMFEESADVSEYMKSLGIAGFVEGDSLMCHKARPSVERIGSKRRIDIKGQI